MWLFIAFVVLITFVALIWFIFVDLIWVTLMVVIWLVFVALTTFGALIWLAVLVQHVCSPCYNWGSYFNFGTLLHLMVFHKFCDPYITFVAFTACVLKGLIQSLGAPFCGLLYYIILRPLFYSHFWSLFSTFVPFIIFSFVAFITYVILWSIYGLL